MGVWMAGNEHIQQLLEQQLDETKRTNRLLEQLLNSQQLLINALAEVDSDPDAEPLTYMDGSPVG